MDFHFVSVESELQIEVKEEPGCELDTVTASFSDNGDSGSFIEPEDPVPPVYYDAPLLKLDLCVNCGVNVRNKKKHTLQLDDISSVIRQWVAPLQITEQNYVCDSCWRLAQDATYQPEDERKRCVGHRSICVLCGKSLLRARFYRLNSEAQGNIRIVVSEWIEPRILQFCDKICKPCNQRAQTTALKLIETIAQSSDPQSPEIPESSQSTQEETIYLPNYIRAPISHSRCFYPTCKQKQLLVVPNNLRMRLFMDYNFYVSRNCKICEYHLRNPIGIDIEDLKNPIHTFTAEHIEDYTDLLKQSLSCNIDFDNILNMDDHLFKYWYGFTKSDIQDLLIKVPALASMPRGLFALGAYLMKLRSRQSSESIALLLKTSRRTLERLMKKVKELLEQDFIPPEPLKSEKD